TAPTVRAYLGSGVQGSWKVAYSGPMFRYERPQKGRRRQFYQVGAEHLESEDPAADAAIIELGYRFLDGLGVPGVEVQLNSLGDAEDRPAYLAILRAWLEERREQLCDDSWQTMEINPMRVLDCKTCAPLLVDAPTPVAHLGDPAASAYASVKEYLAAAGVPFVEQPRLVRGLDYYTRTAFEFVATELDAAQTALGGGGRYDGLSEAIGGRKVPGVGLAMGIDRIVLAMGDAEAGEALDAFIVATPGREMEARGLLSRLRASGARVDMADSGRSVKAQFKAADRSGAPSTLVVGDEWEAGEITARRMADGTQESIRIEEIRQWLEL
ncbi:MAG: histidine--tRNA ligase, partial [Acidimicrobiia bacterium]|nr:histidine--tRNA ligase [Acidimicrobiia bacterium]